MTTLEEARERYLRWRTELFAASTVKNDKVALNNFTRAIGEGWHLDEITPELGAAAVKYVRANMRASSANQWHAQMSAFFNWCIEEQLVPQTWNPFRNQRYLTVAPTDHPRLHKNEFPAFLEAAKNPRDRMSCALGMFLFIRCSESVSLRLKDVRLDHGLITVTVHKTKDLDHMPMPLELEAEVRRWLTYYTEQCGPLDPDWYFVPAHKPNREFHLNPKAKDTKPEQIVQRVAAAAGIDLPKGQGGHYLRRSGARAWFDELCEQGVDSALRTVSAHLHHSSTAMTEKYLGITADRIRRDRLLTGRRMFSGADTGNVVQLRKAT